MITATATTTRAVNTFGCGTCFSRPPWWRDDRERDCRQRAAHRATPSSMAAITPEAFALFDTNGDGFLTPNEVIDILTRQTGGQPMSLADATEFVACFDIDGDGRLDYAELCRAFAPPVAVSAGDVAAGGADVATAVPVGVPMAEPGGGTTVINNESHVTHVTHVTQVNVTHVHQDTLGSIISAASSVASTAAAEVADNARAVDAKYDVSGKASAAATEVASQAAAVDERFGVSSKAQAAAGAAEEKLEALGTAASATLGQLSVWAKGKST